MNVPLIRYSTYWVLQITARRARHVVDADCCIFRASRAKSQSTEIVRSFNVVQTRQQPSSCSSSSTTAPQDRDHHSTMTSASVSFNDDNGFRDRALGHQIQQLLKLVCRPHQAFSMNSQQVGRGGPPSKAQSDSILYCAQKYLYRFFYSMISGDN